MKLKNVITISFLLSITSLQALSEINLNEFRVNKRSGSYSDFSRDDLLRYRGVGPELTPPQAIRAMLGDKSASMKSMLTDGIRLSLMKQSIPFAANLTGYFDSSLNSKISRKIVQNNDQAYSNYDASILAMDMSENHFENKYSDNDILNRFIDYSSPIYYDYPNDPREVVFTTAYMEIAANYSSHVAVISENSEKSIDLNYFNYVKNGTWIRKIKPWPDRGEFITAIGVPARDITGYEIRNNFVKDFETFAVPGNNLRIAFYKVEANNQSYVLIIKGNNKEGIYKQGSEFTYAYSNINPVVDVPQTLNDTQTKAEVVGIISLCPMDKACTAPSKLLKKYDVDQSGKVSNYYLKQIKNIKVNKKQAKVFIKNKEIKANQYITMDETVILSPSVKVNQDLESLKDIAKLDLSNDKYLKIIGYQEATAKDNTSLEYDLTNEMKFGAGDSIYFVIPAKYQTLEIDNIEIVHRKNNSQDYATMSVQIFSPDTSNWRTSGDLDRKGKLDSPVAQDMQSTQPSIINGWQATEHKKFPYGDQINQSLKAQALRVMSIGRKNNYFQKLKINFKGSL
jgi:hypothetical protein